MAADARVDMANKRSSWREWGRSTWWGLKPPAVWTERKCEWLSDRLKRWAFIDVLERIGHLAIVIAVLFYVLEAPERKKAKHYQAWQMINSAKGQRHSGGRDYALQELSRDGVSMAGIGLMGATLPNLEMENAKLPGALLDLADLQGSNLRGSDLSNSQISGCNLCGANLSGACLAATQGSQLRLERANMSRADLTSAQIANASLEGANLFGADLSGACLDGSTMNAVTLRKARLARTLLRNVSLENADLTEADLSKANLTYANLANIRNWQSISDIRLANLYGVKNAPEKFLEWAQQHGAVTMKDDHAWRQLTERE